MKTYLYTSAEIYGSKQTGGIKRFCALAEYLSKNECDYVLYSRDDDPVIENHGIHNFIKMRGGESVPKILPPEMRYLKANYTTVNELKRSVNGRVIIFDVPTAIGPILCGLRNVVLMIRKDMIGYERIQNKGKLKWLKICFQWLCESICMLRSKQIITQCIYDKNVLKKRHPLLAARIEIKTVIQINNVNPSWIVSKSNEGIAGKPNLSKNGFKVCFVGGFDNPRKGQDLFLEAASEVLKESGDVNFVLIGGGVKLEEYKQKYECKNITFMGRQDNPIKILRQCDLLVVPSFADSCPNTVMEALYNEVPVIGSKAGGIPEILNNEDWVFDLDSSKLKEKIIYFKNDKEKLLQLKDLQKDRKQELTFDWAERIISIVNS